MHHTCNFATFVCDLLFSLCLSCFKHLFYKCSLICLKKCSPPSVGSMILKAAHKQNHEKFAFGLLHLRQYAPFLHHLLHPEFCKIHWKNVHFLFIAPFGKTYLALSALSYALNAKLKYFRIASAIIL